MNRWKLIVSAVGLAMAFSAGVARAGYADPLDVPAMNMTGAASFNPMTAVTVAGQRVVAVGRRGVILVSDDRGKQWKQAKVPVSVDLTAVHFPTAQLGWAVGHGGVILHSVDGGLTWRKKLDGRQVAALISSRYAGRAPTGNDEAESVLDDARRLADEGPLHPFLDVWFEDEKTGYAVGAFNLILRTEDGGASWQPWMERTDNPNALHMYSVRSADGEVIIAGEQGLVLRLDRKAQRFEALPQPSRGSLFGVVVQRDALWVYGLRGNVFRSADTGRTWQQIALPTQSTLTGATALRDGRIVIASQGGRVLISAAGGNAFTPLAVAHPMSYAGVAAVGDATIALVGLNGVSTQLLH